MINKKPKKMKVLTGHLTAHEKKVIKAILRSAAQQAPFFGVSASVGRKTYKISTVGNGYSVVITQKDRGMMPVAGTKLRLSSYTSTFTS